VGTGDEDHLLLLAIFLWFSINVRERDAERIASCRSRAEA
jgi:hypothetical protein